MPTTYSGILIQSSHGAVGNFVNLAKPVRNINHADALRAQLLDDFQQPRRFTQRQAGCRLIHNQYARVERKRFGNLDHLLMRNGKTAEQHVRRDVQSEPLQMNLRVGIHTLTVN